MDIDKMTAMVMVRVSRRRAVRARAWATVHGVLVIGALAGLVPAWRNVAGQAAASGFTQYFSLLFSDGGSVFGYWKDFALTIAESVPVIGSGAIVAVLLVLLYSARKMAGDISSLRAYTV